MDVEEYVSQNETVIRFDGAIVEFLSPSTRGPNDRFHASHVSISLDQNRGDEKKERIWFAVTKDKGRDRLAAPFSESERPRLEELKQAIEAAGA